MKTIKTLYIKTRYIIPVYILLLAQPLLGAISYPENLWKHFCSNEFKCKCCGEVVVDNKLIDKLEELRVALGDKPIIITSGYRCLKHNKDTGGVKNSQHLYGRAADIKVIGLSPEYIGKQATKVGFSFVKVYSSWVHVDVRR